MNHYTWNTNECLGMGSYSKVYKGEYDGPDNKYVSKGAPVAVKVIRLDGLTVKALDVISEEINVMKNIKEEPHFNIVKCYDVFREQRQVCIMMEYCDGGNLRTILRKPIKEKYVRYYFRQLTSGLRYLYNKGIMHRDIKPKNILLTNNRRYLKIADFGLAKSVTKNTLCETMCGSPLYMAPEIVSNKRYNDQTDLWSIGMILYEMLYGHHPLNKCHSFAEIKSTINTIMIPIPPNPNPNADVSAMCLIFLRKLLQLEASNRMQWSDFFECEWNNPVLVDGRKKSSGSIGSVTQDWDFEDHEVDMLPIKKYSEIKIMDGYIDEMGNNQTDGIFEME